MPRLNAQRPTYGMTLRLPPEIRDFIYEQASLYGEPPARWVVLLIEKRMAEVEKEESK